MKFRQKTFLILIIIFVVCLNVGMLCMAHVTYDKQLQSIKQKALGETFFIASSLSNDLQTLSENLQDTDQNEETLFDLYTDYYEKKKITFGLWKDTKRKFSNLAISTQMSDLLKVSGDQQNVMIRKENNRNYLLIAEHLTGSFSNYTLVYAYAMDDLDDTWKDLTNLYIMAGAVITTIVAIALAITLRNLMKPLVRLTDATKDIAAGEYGNAIMVKGKDEFAELSDCFNEMSHSIKNNIAELEEINEKKQILIDNMAHELRTPLTSISGYADYMLRANLDEEEQYESLQYIRSESDRLTRMSQTLLNLADIRNDKIQMTDISVEELKQHLEQLTKKLLEAQKVTLVIESSVDTLPGNRELVFSLLENLIENSIRACEENGTIRLFIEKNDTETMIQIKDNGKGMSEEDLEKIREPFYRVDKDRSRRFGGVGLGVTLCYQIVKCHQGTMEYESTVGVGTTVTIHWNLELEKEE